MVISSSSTARNVLLVTVSHSSMTEAQARRAIKDAGGSWTTFSEWMYGQTMGLNEDGSSEYYDEDVNRFIRYKCDPTNEPLAEYD